MSKKLRGPRQFNDYAGLKRVRVELIDERRLHYRCKVCGTVWSPNRLPRGGLPRGYWQCPRGCTEEVQMGYWHYVGDEATKVYHHYLSDCVESIPEKRQVSFFDSEAAERDGFQPCHCVSWHKKFGET